MFSDSLYVVERQGSCPRERVCVCVGVHVCVSVCVLVSFCLFVSVCVGGWVCDENILAIKAKTKLNKNENLFVLK